MKKVFLILILPFLFMTQELVGQATHLDWQYNLESALKKAKKQDKNVILYFTGSDWCSPCKMLKKDLFETADFQDISKNYILVYIDIPRNQDLLTSKQLAYNNKTLKAYNKRKVFPLFMVMNKKGKVLDERSGYAMDGNISYHIQLFNKYL